jgi:hypothetical protein
MKIAVSHPGKIGDCLYALPTARRIADDHDCRVDFYTSEACKPILDLFLQQNCINSVIIPDDYEIKAYDMGVQPWEMPIEGYDKVYHLGFRGIPDKAIPEFIAESAGYDASVGKRIQYDNIEKDFEEYYVVAPRGVTTFTDFFADCIMHLQSLDKKVYIIGGVNENPFKSDLGVDMTGNSYLEMTKLIANSKGFIGLMSSPLVIANGFDMPKIIPHDGKSWDMRHVVHSSNTHYMVNPNVWNIKSILG